MDCVIGVSKYLIQRDSLKDVDAKNLQNCVEASIEIESLLDEAEAING